MEAAVQVVFLQTILRFLAQSIKLFYGQRVIAVTEKAKVSRLTAKS